MHTRYYLQALGITGLFILMLLIVWVATGGAARQAQAETQVQNANSTRTAIAKTEVFLMRPWPTDTPPSFVTPTLMPPTSAAPTFIAPTNIIPTSVAPGITNVPPTSIAPTSVVPLTNVPLTNIAATSVTPLPTGVPPTNGTPTGTSGSVAGRQPILPFASTPLPNQTAVIGTPGIPQTGLQTPADFARWYFERVWKERDYQNLWDHYLTDSFKAHVGSGRLEDYVAWWDSVEQVDVNSVDVLENNGTNAWIRVNLNLHMKNGHVLPNQIFDYTLLYDAARATWMFDYR